jgi:GntR family transcriptional regulator/MocR family aminotransferase
MKDLNIVLEPDSPVGLQLQLRRRLIDAISRGVLRPGRRLPSSRRLADLAGVSRNTVVLAYASLLAEGHLVSRPRSGIFVTQSVPSGRVAVRAKSVAPESPLIAGILAARTPDGDEFRCAPNWHRYPYPFIDGRIDPTLLPAHEWREATRLAYARHEACRWGVSADGADDSWLIDELRSKILPTRGIDALPEEILVTISSRQALQLIADLIVQRGTPVSCEEPMDPEVRRRLRERQANILPGELTEAGLPESTVTFACTRRLAASYAAVRERGRRLLRATVQSCGIFIEHDLPPDVQDTGRVIPPMRAIDRSGRTVFVMSLSAFAAAGAPLGVVVAERPFINELRRLRYNLGAGPAPASQRAWAHFIALGHYAAAVTRASRLLSERRIALRDALNYHMRKSVVIETFAGASAYWVRGTGGLNVAELTAKAAAAGVLIEPLSGNGTANTFRMGVTGISAERIPKGVQMLARLVRLDPAQMPRRLAEDRAPMRGAALRQAITGAVLLYTTVYNDPCTIEIHRDGTLVGRAGHHDEDCDGGRWWIEGDRWYRQWRNWVYGEATGFDIVIEGAQMRWYGSDGLLADTAVIAGMQRGGSAAAVEPEHGRRV